MARRLADACIAEVRPLAIALAGSGAEGTADWLSDLDLVSYHDRMPSRERLDVGETLDLVDAHLPGLDTGPVHVANVLRLAANVESLGRFGLHAETELERANSRLESRIIVPRLKVRSSIPASPL